LFNDLFIIRYPKDSTVGDAFKVPLRYSGGFRYEALPQDEASRDGPLVAMVVPAMSFQLAGFEHDPSRQTGKNVRMARNVADPDDTVPFQFNRVPYNFNFELCIRTKNLDDMLQIVEQIIPAFKTPLAVRMDDGDDITAQQDIHIGLDDVQMSDNYDDYNNNRKIDWTLNFTLKGYIYCRTQTGDIIREVQVLGSASNKDDSLGLEQLFQISAPQPDQTSAVERLAVEVELDMFTGLSVDTVEKAVGTVRQRTTKRK